MSISEVQHALVSKEPHGSVSLSRPLARLEELFGFGSRGGSTSASASALIASGTMSLRLDAYGAAASQRVFWFILAGAIGTSEMTAVMAW